VPLEIRQLIRAMSLVNPLWGAPRIHGELLKLGIEIGQTSVAKYMARHRKPPSQGWKTFLRNHADGIASMDLFVVPTLSFRLLYGLLILSHGRRQILWLGVTAHPTAEWIARQLTEACGWERTPKYIVRDRDRLYGEIFTRRLRAMGIRDRPTAPQSPWQNGHTERLIGSIRRHRVDETSRPEGQPHDRKAATRQDECPGNDQSPLRARAVDKGTNRGIRHNVDEAAGREHGADRGLAPLRVCEQEDVHIGAEPAAHICEEEIEPVKSIQPAVVPTRNLIS
jgi:hypothetical protein